MRQSDHVSPETGKRLRDGGLQWQPAVGDWMVTPDESGPVLVVAVDEGEPESQRYSYVLYDCTWLPSTGQLLEVLLSIRGSGCVTVARYPGLPDRAHVLVPQGGSLATITMLGMAAEALAEAWLRLHAPKGGDVG